MREERKFGLGGGYRQTGLRHQAQESHGFQRDRFAAGIGAADQQRAAVFIQFQAHRYGRFAPPPQHVLAQQQPFAEARDDAIELDRKARLGEDQIQLRHNCQRLADGIGVAAQTVRHFEQDAVDFAGFLFAQPHQLVVEVDGFERLDEQGVPAGADAVDDAIELAALPGDHGHHEALVADGHEFFLEHAFLAVRAQEPFERFLDGFLLALHVAADAGQRDAGVVGDAAVGQDLAFQVFQQGPEIADGLGAPPQPRKTLGRGGQQRLGVGGAVEQGEEVEDFLGFEAGAFDVKLLYGEFGIGKAVEIDADGAASRGGACGGAEVFDGLAGFRQVFGEARAVGVRLDFIELAPAERARDIAAEELAEGFEFEDFGTGFHAYTRPSPGAKAHRFLLLCGTAKAMP